MGYRQASDTFVMEIDGIPHGVTKGTVLSEDHPVVRHDMANGGLLFAPLDLGEDKKAPAKSGPDPAEDAPVKAPVRAAVAKAPAKGGSGG